MDSDNTGAALTQSLCNAVQRHLTDDLGATLVRFHYGLPFATLWLIIAWLAFAGEGSVAGNQHSLSHMDRRCGALTVARAWTSRSALLGGAELVGLVLLATGLVGIVGVQ